VRTLNAVNKLNHLFLEQYINELLDVGQFQDYCPNGLQVEGKLLINKIATAVTASQYVLEQCVRQQVDALIVHHGYFWKGENPVVKGAKKNRLSTLIKNDINLYAYHLPLDAYPQWGNNASIATKLNIIVSEKRSWHKQSDLLWLGTLSNAETPSHFYTVLQQTYGPQVNHVTTGKQLINSVAWCSGAAQDLIEYAITLGVDAYITGEYSERSYHQAKEAGVEFYAIGHHASEKDGVCNLGKYLAEKFSLEHIFIDENNPF
jgi:dinuclear metal center YbgI/SA1388 family protein